MTEISNAPETSIWRSLTVFTLLGGLVFVLVSTILSVAISATATTTLGSEAKSALLLSLVLGILSGLLAAPTALISGAATGVVAWFLRTRLARRVSYIAACVTFGAITNAAASWLFLSKAAGVGFIAGGIAAMVCAMISWRRSSPQNALL